MEASEEPKFHVGSQQGTAGPAQRPRFLYCCGVSALAVARHAYNRVEGLGGPVGTLARHLASWVAPVLCPLQRRWLSLLSSADGHILAVEDAVAFVFPPATRLFRALNELALLSETLPKELDDAADRLPGVIRRLPLLGWAWAKLGGRPAWDDGGAAAGEEEEEEEREITCVDDHPDAGEGEEELRPLDDPEEALEDDVLRRVRGMQERVIVDKYESRGGVEEGVAEEEGKGLAVEKAAAEDEAGKGSPGEEIVVGPILELFHEGWHTTPRKRR